MRKILNYAAALLLALSSLPAQAQVKVDPRALDDATPAKPAAPAPAKARPPAKRPAKRTSAATPAPAPAPVVEAPPPPPVPVMPVYAPAPPVLPPPIVVPMRQAAPVTPAVVVPDAPGSAAPLGEGGLRVVFGTDRADLNPASAAALKALAHKVPADRTIAVTAFAPPSGEDLSAPRRLSLARALTVRSVLLSEGIASPRVVVRALGGVPGAADGGVADRVDVLPAVGTP